MGGNVGSVVEKIFTTEDPQVHRDAQGEMKRIFYECWFGSLVRFGIIGVKRNSTLLQSVLRADFAWPFAENEV
jgi:hypothetical protein